MKNTKLYLVMALCLVLTAFAASAHAQTQTFKTGGGDLKVTPVYHAGLYIEAGGKIVYVDPAKPGVYTGLPKADLILITHDHGDHVDMDQASIKAVQKDGTEIWAPEAVQKIVPSATVIKN